MIQRNGILLGRAVVAIAFVLAVVVVGAGCRKGGPPPARGPAEVAIVTMAPERIVLTTELPGRSAPFLIADVRPQVSGLIRERLFEEGSDVKAGDRLYQIDPDQYQAAYDQAKAALEVAEASIPALRSRAERLADLVAIRAAGQQDSDNAQAELRRAEAGVAASRAAMESARIALSYTPVKAPIRGRIGRSNVTVGALVTAFQPVPLATIQQLDPMYVDVTQSTSELLRLRKSFEAGRLRQNGTLERKVKLILEDGTPYPLAGKLKFQDVTADPTTGSVTLRLVFPNPEMVLLPGMFVRAVVEEGVNDQAILVPQQGVSRDPRGEAIAWVVDSSEKVEQRTLRLDRAIGNRWLVTKGLSAGDRVIVEGLQKVRPGDPVRAVPFAPASAAAPPASQAQPPAEKR